MPETRYPTDTHYSPHFRRSELECKCGCIPDRRIRRRLRVLAVQLERMRVEYGRPITVVNGYRCAKRNKAVGGAVKSQHIQGRAADIYVPRGEQWRMRKAAERVPRFRSGGIGVYPNGGIHVDTRTWVARWSSFVGQ